MLQSSIINDGAITLTIYDFPEIGDILEKHTHDKTTVHYTIVAAGTVNYQVTGEPDKTYTTGSIIKSLPGQEHGFVSLTPRARIVNIPYGKA